MQPRMNSNHCYNSRKLTFVNLKIQCSPCAETFAHDLNRVPVLLENMW